MAKDIFRSPLAEVRWAHLISPRHQLDKSKPKAWTADLLLPNSDERAQSFLLAMEDQFIALHGSRKRRAEKGFLPGVNYVGGSRQLRRRVVAPTPLPWQGGGPRFCWGRLAGN